MKTNDRAMRNEEDLGSGAFVLQDAEFELIGAGGSLLLIIHHLQLFVQSMFVCCYITALDLTGTQIMCLKPFKRISPLKTSSSLPCIPPAVADGPLVLLSERIESASVRLPVAKIHNGVQKTQTTAAQHNTILNRIHRMKTLRIMTVVKC